MPDLSLVFPANFGWPFSTNASLSDALLLAALVGIITVLGLGDRQARDATPTVRSALVAAGTWSSHCGTAALRALPVRADRGRRPVELPLVVRSGHGHRRVAVCGVAAPPGGRVAIGFVLLVLALDVRWYRTGLWSTAASDGVVVAHAALDRAEPGVTVSVGPGLVITDNITPFADSSTIRGAVQFLHGSRDVNAVMVYDEAEFIELPASERLDQRRLTELDGAGR